MAEPDNITKAIALSLEIQAAKTDEVVKALDQVTKAVENVSKKTDEAENKFKKLDDVTNKIKGTFQAFSHVASNLTLGLGTGLGFKEAIDYTERYSKALLQVGSQWTKYGAGAATFEKTVENLGKSISLTRMETMQLFSAYEKGFPYASLKGAEQLFTNIRNVVGSNKDAIDAMAQSLSQLASEYPDIEESIERLNAADKTRLTSLSNIMVLTGKMSLQQAKGLADYVNQNKQLNSYDEERKKNAESFVKSTQDIRKEMEAVVLKMGNAMLPTMETISKLVQEISPAMQKIGGFLGGWMFPLAAIGGVLGSIAGLSKMVIGTVSAIGGLTSGAGKILSNAGKAGSVAGKAGGLLGKAGGAITGITDSMATPVRVVNFPSSLTGQIPQGTSQSSAQAAAVEESKMMKMGKGVAKGMIGVGIGYSLGSAVFGPSENTARDRGDHRAAGAMGLGTVASTIAGGAMMGGLPGAIAGFVLSIPKLVDSVMSMIDGTDHAGQALDSLTRNFASAASDIFLNETELKEKWVGTGLRQRIRSIDPRAGSEASEKNKSEKAEEETERKIINEQVGAGNLKDINKRTEDLQKNLNKETEEYKKSRKSSFETGVNLDIKNRQTSINQYEDKFGSREKQASPEVRFAKGLMGGLTLGLNPLLETIGDSINDKEGQDKKYKQNLIERDSLSIVQQQGGYEKTRDILKAIEAQKKKNIEIAKQENKVNQDTEKYAILSAMHDVLKGQGGTGPQGDAARIALVEAMTKSVNDADSYNLKLKEEIEEKEKKLIQLEGLRSAALSYQRQLLEQQTQLIGTLESRMQNMTSLMAATGTMGTSGITEGREELQSNLNMKVEMLDKQRKLISDERDHISAMTKAKTDKEYKAEQTAFVNQLEKRKKYHEGEMNKPGADQKYKEKHQKEIDNITSLQGNVKDIKQGDIESLHKVDMATLQAEKSLEAEKYATEKKYLDAYLTEINYAKQLAQIQEGLSSARQRGLETESQIGIFFKEKAERQRDLETQKNNTQEAVKSEIAAQRKVMEESKKIMSGEGVGGEAENRIKKTIRGRIGEETGIKDLTGKEKELATDKRMADMEKDGILQAEIKVKAAQDYETALAKNNTSVKTLVENEAAAAKQAEELAGKWERITAASSGSFESIVKLQQETGNIDPSTAASAIEDMRRNIEKTIPVLEETRDKYLKMSQLENISEATKAEYNAKSVEAQNKINNAKAKSLEMGAAEIQVYDKKIRIASEEANYAKGLVDLYDNFATGIGASVEMRQVSVEKLKQERSLMENQLSIIMNEIERKRETEELHEKRIKKENEILGIVKQQADITKSLRDGWIGAINASLVGSGRIAKFVISSKENAGIGLEYLNGMVTSNTSGAVGRGGSKKGERFTTQYGAIENPNPQGYVADTGGMSRDQERRMRSDIMNKNWKGLGKTGIDLVDTANTNMMKGGGVLQASEAGGAQGLYGSSLSSPSVGSNSNVKYGATGSTITSTGYKEEGASEKASSFMSGTSESNAAYVKVVNFPEVLSSSSGASLSSSRGNYGDIGPSITSGANTGIQFGISGTGASSGITGGIKQALHKAITGGISNRDPYLEQQEKIRKGEGSWQGNKIDALNKLSMEKDKNLPGIEGEQARIRYGTGGWKDNKIGSLNKLSIEKDKATAEGQIRHSDAYKTPQERIDALNKLSVSGGLQTVPPPTGKMRVNRGGVSRVAPLLNESESEGQKAKSGKGGKYEISLNLNVKDFNEIPNAVTDALTQNLAGGNRGTQTA